jgi:purine-nucleoside phosphorylase
MIEGIYEKVQEAGAYLTSRIATPPMVGIVLGSGLSGLRERVSEKLVIPNKEIPGFPVSTVAGHEGRLIFGRIGGLPLGVGDGRVHYYEGYPLAQVTLAIRVMARLGCKAVILTSAVGGIRSDLEPGTLVTITDHINFMGTNPLIGLGDSRLGERFVDLSYLYDRDLRETAHATAIELGIPLKDAVLAATSGPSYESPAEVRMLGQLGADIVGMSLVPEAIVARQCVLRVLGISCVTNRAAGLSEAPLNHKEVLEVTARAASQFQRLVEAVIGRLKPVLV